MIGDKHPPLNDSKFFSLKPPSKNDLPTTFSLGTPKQPAEVHEIKISDRAPLLASPDTLKVQEAFENLYDSADVLMIDQQQQSIPMLRKKKQKTFIQ